MPEARVKGRAHPLRIISALLAPLMMATLELPRTALGAGDAPPPELDPNSGLDLAPPTDPRQTDEEQVEVPNGTIVIDDTRREPILYAKTFNVRVLRRSTSNRVYMFEKTSGELPEAGRILLIREDEMPVMAFRVIRVYPETQTLAARKLKRYTDEVRALPKRKLYTAVEKVADLVIESELERLEKSKDASDLGELEVAQIGGGPAPAQGAATAGPAGATPALKPLPTVAEYDPELDMPLRGPFATDKNGTGADTEDQPASDGLDGTYAADEESSFEDAGLVAREVNPYDFFSNGFSAMGEFLRNNGSEGQSIYARALGFKYAHTTHRMLLLKRTQFQDSLAFEAGVSFYKAYSYAAENDAYGVTHATLGARYNIHFSPGLAVFFYAGLGKPFVTDAVQATEEAVSQLTAFLPSAGAGLILGVGPNWDLRADVGFDQIGAGLMLRF